jgi:curved DNA-binding protein CbpA
VTSLTRGPKEYNERWSLFVPDARVRTPKPVPRRGGIDGIRLTPTDGFVLSRVDGTTTEHDLVATTGLPGDEVQASLGKLESLGLISYEPAAPPASDPDATARYPAVAAPEPPPLAPLSPEDEAALAEEVDIDPDMRRRVLALYPTLERLDHYALLGVKPDADKKQIKRAYFDLAAKFHPDRYFRKRLGSFKPKMEVVFGRITLAHDTLTDKARRAEYDGYLEEQRRSRGIEELLADALEEIRRAEADAEQAAQATSPTADVSVPPAPPAQSARAPDARTPSPNVSAAARRDALARRLLGSRSITPAGAVAANGRIASSPAMPAVTTATDAVEALRRRYEERRGMARLAQARKYVADGEAALATADAVSAANAFRVAASLCPDDPAIVALARDAQGRADAILADTYTRQAEYEEKNGQWSDAARSWSRVCRTRTNDAHAHERAANALAKSDGDLHEASRLAQRACSIEPASALHRVTLASVYLAAGLTLNARRELETAAQLAPHDGTIPEMLKRLSTSA